MRLLLSRAPQIDAIANDVVAGTVANTKCHCRFCGAADYERCTSFFHHYKYVHLLLVVSSYKE